jgi:xanthine dehydrogenase accessory factor
MKKERIKNVYEMVKKGETADLSFEAGGKDYVRRWRPKERLILLGCGHISQPLCKIAAMLSFEVVVVDDRPSFANRMRFPDANQVICDDFLKAIDDLNINQNDYICIITRGHRYDSECLHHILDKEAVPFYLGMIGSKRRVRGLKELLLEEGYDKEQLDRLNAPIGLSIHAETTTEIAVSIVAQLIEYRRSRGKKKECLSDQNIDYSMLEALGIETEDWVMAVVLETKGSTPVKSGAMMAVNVLGQTRGTIGGGCSEGEVIQIARRMAGTNERKVVMVDMTNDVAEEEGMVCGGTMKVLVESME